MNDLSHSLYPTTGLMLLKEVMQQAAENRGSYAELKQMIEVLPLRVRQEYVQAIADCASGSDRGRMKDEMQTLVDFYTKIDPDHPESELHYTDDAKFQHGLRYISRELRLLSGSRYDAGLHPLMAALTICILSFGNQPMEVQSPDDRHHMRQKMLALHGHDRESLRKPRHPDRSATPRVAGRGV